MNGCKYLAGRIRQRSSISSSLLSDCCVGRSSARRSSSFAATLTNDQSIAKRRRCSTTQSSYVLHNNINRIQQHLRLQYFSTSTTDDDEDNVDGGEEELKLVSINDHLDELQHIPLADVRNFCIIAHVVRFVHFVCCIHHHNYNIWQAVQISATFVACCKTLFCAHHVYFFMFISHTLHHPFANTYTCYVQQ